MELTVLTLSANETKEKMSVYQKLQTARVTLQEVEMKKSGSNKFAGYQYFELGDFLPFIQTIFKDIGLCGIVSFTSDIATLKIVDVESKEEIVFTSPMGSASLKGCHEVQNIGAVETYQRRYLWVTALEIVEHDALDAIVGEIENKPKSHAKTINKQQSFEKDFIERCVVAMLNANTVGILKDQFAVGYRYAKQFNNFEEITKITNIYNGRKSELQETLKETDAAYTQENHDNG